MKCSICFCEIPVHPLSGWSEGNNAQPVNNGRCCDGCNDAVVIPARLRLMFEARAHGGGPRSKALRAAAKAAEDAHTKGGE